MPLVSSFDGANRRIVLSSEVEGAAWSPLDVYKEYLAYRRDNHQFRGWSPLVRMIGGEPKGGGAFAPRFLQLLTDNRGITTKLVVPDSGPYRTTVDGEIATDNPDVDPETFDVSGLTTAVVIDYRPPDTELVVVDGGGSGGGTVDVGELVDALAPHIWLAVKSGQCLDC